MLARLQRLFLGIALIAIASSVLVLTDRSGARRDAGGADPQADGPANTDAFDARKRIAIIKYASIAAFETGTEGCLEHLESVGYTKDAGTVFDIFNAEGDQATLAQVCAQVASAPEPYDCVVSLGTAATQAYLRANKRGAPQVMGLVASPLAINVPLGPFVEGSGRPAYLSGFGTAQPIRDLFKTLRALDPAAKRIGVAYNPAEPNSEASVKVARAACAELGLELVEANGANVTEIVNAADVVLSRGVDAYWMPPDTVVSAAAQTLISRASQKGVPAITNFPEMAEKGAAICLGADWIACGMTTGIYAELALAGVDARTLPIDNFTPARLTLCMHAWPARWKAPEGFTESASEVWFSGREPVRRAVDLPMAPAPVLEAREALKARRAGAKASTANAPTAMPTIALLTYNRTPNFEDCYAGFLEEWTRLGFEDGRNCRMTLHDAQFDSGTLNTMAAAIAEERPDLVITFTTPALQAAMRRIKDRTILFSLSSSGVVAGAGRTASDHLPNITGAEVGADWSQMIEVLRATLPNARRVGTIYSPAETNSVYFEKEWRTALAAAGIELVSTPADKATELPEAADALVTAQIDAVVQIADNLTSTGFRSIVRAADRAKLPVFAFAPIGVRHGATVMVTRDYHDVGRLTASLAKRLLAGESPAGIPFASPDRTVFAVNPARLERFGLLMPDALLAQAETGAEEATGSSSSPNPAARGAPR